jgi:hypothetical protein
MLTVERADRETPRVRTVRRTVRTGSPAGLRSAPNGSRRPTGGECTRSTAVRRTEGADDAHAVRHATVQRHRRDTLNLPFRPFGALLNLFQKTTLFLTYLLQIVFYCLQQRAFLATDCILVIIINRPHHYSSQISTFSILHLKLNRLRVIVPYPLGV